MTMTMTITVLSAAVIAEAVVLAGVMTLVLRLRARVTRSGHRQAADLAQMSELVREAEVLSEDLADRLAEQMQLAESLSTRLEAAQAAPMPATTRHKTAAAVATDDIDAPATTKRAASTTKAAATPRSRARVAAARTPREAEEDGGDFQTAVEKGMDPLGIAIQRSLLNKRSALA